MEEMNALGQLLVARIVLRYIPHAFNPREFNKRITLSFPSSTIIETNFGCKISQDSKQIEHN